jgi:hypothetical protein
MTIVGVLLVVLVVLAIVVLEAINLYNRNFSTKR